MKVEVGHPSTCLLMGMRPQPLISIKVIILTLDDRRRENHPSHLICSTATNIMTTFHLYISSVCSRMSLLLRPGNNAANVVLVNKHWCTDTNNTGEY